MTNLVRVLIVEDSSTDARLIVQQLQQMARPVEFERVETAEAMRAALAGSAWDAVLSDWSMPKFTAPAALGILKAMHLDLPFIIVSGTIGEETAIDAMRAGAHDFVLKDRLGRLAPAIERELRQCAERAARRRAESALRESEERLRKALGGEQVESTIVRASSQVTKLATLINDFLDVTQIASKRMVLRPETVDLRRAVDTVVARLSEPLASSGSVIRRRGDAPVVGEWDSLRLRSAILSLISNAIKYGGGKPIDIGIDLQGDEARLVIVDRGIGISIEEQDRVLRRFDGARSQQHSTGSGLGLWIACEIIAAHGGKITVASSMGTGSTFTVLLPLAARAHM